MNIPSPDTVYDDFRDTKPTPDMVSFWHEMAKAWMTHSLMYMSEGHAQDAKRCFDIAKAFCFLANKGNKRGVKCH